MLLSPNSECAEGECVGGAEGSGEQHHTVYTGPLCVRWRGGLGVSRHRTPSDLGNAI